MKHRFEIPFNGREYVIIWENNLLQIGHFERGGAQIQLTYTPEDGEDVPMIASFRIENAIEAKGSFSEWFRAQYEGQSDLDRLDEELEMYQKYKSFYNDLVKVVDGDLSEFASLLHDYQ